MPNITSQDLRLYKGELLLEEIQDGVVNNLFDDIDDIQLVTGGTRLAHCALGLRSDNNDALFVPRVAVLQPPGDDKQTVTIQEAFDANVLQLGEGYSMTRNSTGGIYETFTTTKVGTGASPSPGVVGGFLRVLTGDGAPRADFVIRAVSTNTSGTGASTTATANYTCTLLRDHGDWATNVGIQADTDLQLVVSFTAFETDTTAPLYGITALADDVAVSSPTIELDEVMARDTPDTTAPIFRQNDFILIHSTMSEDLINPVVADTTYTLSRDELAYAEVRDANGLIVSLSLYEIDLDTGEILFPAASNLSEYTQPFTVTHRIEQYNQIISSIPGSAPYTVSLLRLTRRAFAAADTFVSSVFLPSTPGGLKARARILRDQATWSNNWDPVPLPTEAPAEFNEALYPIKVLNRSAISQRWRVQFTSGIAFNLIAEELGQIATGSTDVEFIPERASGFPYFEIMSEAWGSGWANNNTVIFETQAARIPFVVRRVVQDGVPPNTESARLLLAGSVNAGE